ncbi:glyoxylase-like metal-dependent hydrolase (beta-lactamase superfamily II) [Bradyrhizobium sp. USDA 4532]|uniref:MBL fold metallo-hydrolase n=1 Tax=unclassified Bradyrhizobium TaxID=2631580 RepID=UPI0020A1B91F|nr:MULTISPECIES: MBL fold metallo-hydrolase [unclassified Bradyrhizobium]MCP1830856.1 glyoxylase-like metal-dependent hydrolase (beta-lactamase superfamily II) [Bradyrhizobium sp. USDA 4545]MCP1923965.1 glyoxylase-like metal-dependent hydrolase (beta-lactamase superfamily II) [Bradyrhizobium sp. USDA 4532]
MRFAIGDATVDVIVDDDDFGLPLAEFLPGYDRGLIEAHRATLEPVFIDLARGLAKHAIQSFVVRTGGRTLLIDACIGEHKDIPEIPAWHRRRGSGFLDRLRASGIDPAGIDVVFCTHLHVDHVGWNTRQDNGRWQPTFPNARYLFGRRELADWMTQHDAGRAPPIHARALEQSVIPIVEAGRVDLVDDGHQLGPGLRLVPLPGHTSGQMGLMVDYAQHRAIFCGDAVHNPVQIFQPDLSTSSCADPQLARETRTKILEEAADSGRLVIPAHFRGPRCAHVRRDGGGYAPVLDARHG